jgi:Flp pilus assembly pilin Flp
LRAIHIKDWDEKRMFTRLAHTNGLLTREEGQGLAEYALVVLLVSIPVIGTLTACGDYVNQFFSSFISALH